MGQRKVVEIKIPRVLEKINMKSIITFLLLVSIAFISYQSRVSNRAQFVADYDPFYFYRITKELLENNLKPPKWDLLSFNPPGRPFFKSLGWPYMIVIFYKVISVFKPITFMRAAIIAPAIMTGLSAISAFFLGKELSNEWGGLVTAIFATMTPTFIGVSMSGYLDTDAVVVFYSFLCIFLIFMSMRKGKWPYILLSVIANLAFIYSWWFGWYILFFFLLFLPPFILYRIFVHAQKNKWKIKVNEVAKELKSRLAPFFLILIITHIIAYPLGFSHVFDFIMVGLGFTSTGEGMLVNVSVAELQPINIFTRGGFDAIAQRVGGIPMYFMLIGLPVLVLYKLYKRIEIGYEEFFLFIWSGITFYLILSGVRFSLLFSVSVSAAAGYIIGNIVNFVMDKGVFLKSTVLGLVAFLVLIYISQTTAFAMNIGSMDIGQNWRDMLDWLKNNADKDAIVSTWWDPGHIIAGYTGLRVHADGAHCAPSECIPYSHNTRIQDMGRIMSTNDEDEAVDLLKKYMQLTPEQCQEVKKKYGDIVPEEACESASEMYFIASNDLIGKFTWMNYFGGYRAPIGSPQDFARNPGVCCASTPKTEAGQLSCGEFANQGRGLWVWCPWIFGFSKLDRDMAGNPAYVYEYGGLKMSIIQKEDAIIPIYNNQFVINHLVFFDQGQMQDVNFTNLNTTLEKIDGMIWVEPGFRNLIYFSPAIKDSMFVRMFFFDGEGLEHFELVYQNPEIKLYKVNFS